MCKNNENIYISWGPDTQMSISSYYLYSRNTSTFIIIDTKTKPPKHCMHFIKNLFETQLKKKTQHNDNMGISIVWPR